MERIKPCCEAGIKRSHIGSPGCGVVVAHRHDPRCMSAGVLLKQRLLLGGEVAHGSTSTTIRRRAVSTTALVPPRLSWSS